MFYFEQIEKGNVKQVVYAESEAYCVEKFGGDWREVKAPPYVGMGEDGNYIPFPMEKPEAPSKRNTLLNTWEKI